MGMMVVMVIVGRQTLLESCQVGVEPGDRHQAMQLQTNGTSVLRVETRRSAGN